MCGTCGATLARAEMALTITGPGAVLLRSSLPSSLAPAESGGFGIVQGVRIGIALGNSIDHRVICAGRWCIGAVLVELSADDSGDALVATAHCYGLRAIFTEYERRRRIVQHRMTLLWRNELLRKQGDCRAVAYADELEILSLTTGSTGVPSGVISTQRQFMRRIELRLAIYYPKGIPAGTRPNDLLLTAPMRYGWFFTCAVAITGGRRAIGDPAASDQASDLRAIATWKGADLLRHREHVPLLPGRRGRGLRSSRRPSSGSWRLTTVSLGKRDVAGAAAGNFIESYGHCGGRCTSAMSPADTARRPESVGRPLPRLQLQPPTMTARHAGRHLWQDSLLRRSADATALRGKCRSAARRICP